MISAVGEGRAGPGVLCSGPGRHEQEALIMLLAAIAFAVGAGFQLFNGPDIDASTAWPFWLLLALALACFESWHPLIRKR
jgi:hypothetical protein